MRIDSSKDTPLYVQIAEEIENNIFTSIFKEEEQIPSTTEISALLNINPNTILKGMNMLVEEDILYKKRGIGMFVKAGARGLIQRKRQEAFQDSFVDSLLKEAKRLNMSKKELIAIIERRYDDETNSSK